MDKASASGAGDCGFESHQGRFFFFSYNFFSPLFYFFFFVFVFFYAVFSLLCAKFYLKTDSYFFNWC